jgi:nitrous oxide reductase
MGKQQDKSKSMNAGRREFFRTALVATGAAVIAATGSATAAPPTPEPAAAAPKPDSQGYHVTDHIRDYYRVASL